MNSSLNFKSASSMSLTDLAKAFNAGFEGYFYPPQMTVEMLARRVRMEHLDLLQSVLAFDEEVFIGFALMGLRGCDAWCGGLGVVPEFRGRGIARQLMVEFMSRASACGVKKLSLEVLTRNTHAIRLYEHLGLKVTRDLLILERVRSGSDVNERSLDLNDGEPAELLRHYERLHKWRPAWQRDIASLLSADGIQGVYIGKRATPDAYALLVTRPDGVTQVIDLAASDERQATELSERIAQRFGGLRVVNEPEESLFVAALLANGFVEVERQHEMVIHRLRRLRR